jgi:hypothetical protein
MSFLKKAVLALSLSFAMLSVAPTAIAKPAGKIENQSASETAEATLYLVYLVLFHVLHKLLRFR